MLMRQKLKLLYYFRSNQIFKKVFFLILYKFNKLLNSSYSRSFYNPIFKSNYGDQTFKYYIIGTYGSYFSRILRKNTEIDVFIDIGANQGLYSILAAKNKNIEKVYSFEPNKFIFDLLQRNCELNKIKSKIECFNIGVSNYNGYVNLKIPKSHSGAAEIIVNSSNNNLQSNFIIEKIKVVDHEWLNNKIHERTNVGIKIDVEGHESTVIETLSKTNIWNYVTWIYFEVNPTKYEMNSTFELLNKNGFQEENRVNKDDQQFDVMMRRINHLTK